MRARRLLLLTLSVLLGLMAVTALLTPVPPAGDGGPQRAQPPSAPTGATPASEPGLSPRERDASPPGEEPHVLSAARRNQEIVAPPGQELRLEVRSRRPVTVQIGLDGPIEFADAGSPAEFSLWAEPGLDAAVMLLEPERTIGRITVRP